MDRKLEAVRLAAALGAEVRGISLGTADAADVDEIQSLLTEHLVLFFPEAAPDD